ncbi:hypothetical protein ABEP12_01885 [Bacillus velezensis]
MWNKFFKWKKFKNNQVTSNKSLSKRNTSRVNKFDPDTDYNNQLNAINPLINLSEDVHNEQSHIHDSGSHSSSHSSSYDSGSSVDSSSF